MPNYIEVLGEAYTNAVAEKELSVIPQNVRNYVQSIVSKAEDNKGVIAVLTTLMTHKIIHPEQDIRKHQVQIEGGFGGRTRRHRCGLPGRSNEEGDGNGNRHRKGER